MLNQNIDFYINFKGPSPLLTTPRKMDIVKAFTVSGYLQNHVYKTKTMKIIITEQCTNTSFKVKEENSAHPMISIAWLVK